MWEDETDEPVRKDEEQGEPRRTAIPWTAATVLLAITIPVCGWLVTLSNRVSALEVKTESLATAAQMSEVKQRISDWIEESDRAHVDDRVRAARESK